MEIVVQQSIVYVRAGIIYSRRLLLPLFATNAEIKNTKKRLKNTKKLCSCFECYGAYYSEASHAHMHIIDEFFSVQDIGKLLTLCVQFLTFSTSYHVRIYDNMTNK